ncbi:DUF3784 domain-containing protein [Candidatus Stoquefichus sp. SB1]|uniref:DUF3784 domain-containing protein n=1 Tax=Candidatus Stoquefichus sp. SB1 TaxID=1658109 RepID=UPI00067F63CE|nr:DUF3784 domain-containing protein [Candidatus Stoquefichus sp. SB1]
MLVWGLCGLFAVMSILFLLGKGSFLIAGYNSASASEKAKYNEKKLCRVMGIGMGFIALGMLAVALNEDKGILFMMIGLLSGILIMTFATNFCYSEDYIVEMSQQSHHAWYKRKETWGSMIGIVVVIVVGILMFVGDIHIDYQEQMIQIGATMTKSMDIEYQDIKSVEYVDKLDTGQRTFGIGNAVIEAGKFKNSQFGSYRLYAYKQCHTYVVIHVNETIVVVNQKTVNETKKIYDQIHSYIEKSNITS